MIVQTSNHFTPTLLMDQFSFKIQICNSDINLGTQNTPYYFATVFNLHKAKLQRKHSKTRETARSLNGI